MGNTNVREGVAAREAGSASGDGSVEHQPLEGVSNTVTEAHYVASANANIPGRYQQTPSQTVHGYHPQVDGGRENHVGSSESMGRTPPDSPGSSARSPMMFTPQSPMVPIPRVNQVGRGPHSPWTYESPTYDEGQQEHNIATLIQWSHGGNDVFVEGSWDNWSTRIPLYKAGKDFTLVKLLPSGVYEYRFVVNGAWKYSPDLPWIRDEMGNVNNILDVQDSVPENLDSIAGFESPSSPETSYDNPFPGPEDYGKEPPLSPPHLHLTLLNVTSNRDPPSTSVSVRPQHVILNHLFVEKGKAARSVLALGLTHRFRSKYVTVVLHKPLRR